MHNIFLDCGFYSGVSTRKYLDAEVIDTSWKVYAFEPRPDFDIQLQLDKLPLSVEVVKKAVWIEDGKVGFDVSGHENAAYIKSTRNNESHDNLEMVETVDFSQFIGDLPLPSYVICSMDIEGAEFEVLEKMLRDNTIYRIQILDIEFHHRLMPNYTHDDSRQLIKNLKRRGIDVRLKEVLE